MNNKKRLLINLLVLSPPHRYDSIEVRLNIAPSTTSLPVIYLYLLRIRFNHTLIIHTRSIEDHYSSCGLLRIGSIDCPKLPKENATWRAVNQLIKIINLRYPESKFRNNP